jgi:hypothetical protein
MADPALRNTEHLRRAGKAAHRASAAKTSSCVNVMSVYSFDDEYE